MVAAKGLAQPLPGVTMDADGSGASGGETGQDMTTRHDAWMVVAIITLLAVSPAMAQCDEIQELLASDGVAGDSFGRTAISGDVAMVGAEDDGDRGSVYVFGFDGTSWVEGQKLQASDGAAGDDFGKVVLDGGVAVVGARKRDDNGLDSGAAYVFRFNGANWQEEQKLLASDGAAGDELGNSVALSGNVAVIGARLDDDNGSNAGAAYVFRFNGASWVQEQKLLASDGATDDLFGLSVAVSGDVAVAGARFDDDNGGNSGSAYVFRFNGASWEQEQKLVASDAAQGLQFGQSVSVDGDVVLVGTLGTGVAYVFRFNGASWEQEQKLLPSDGAQGFGGFLVLDGETAVIGASSDDNANGNNAGSAFVFRFNGASWEQEQKLMASDGAASDRFGSFSQIAVSGDVVLIGTRNHDHIGDNAGSVYVFVCSPPCPWDCGDNDGNVGIVDFLAVLAQWGTPGSCDFDGGGVGINDFLALLANWGPCP